VNPAFSVVFFTTLAGAAQGLVVTLALAACADVPMSLAFQQLALVVAVVMLVAALLISFLHLGRPGRAWRAVLMWRTSWLSREVIVLPAYIAVVALWWLALGAGVFTLWLPLLALVMSVALWYCTGMIYACIRFIQEWAHPLTLVNFMLGGMASGLVLACALAATRAEIPLLASAGPCALVVTLVAWFMRARSLQRNARLVPRSTLQTATGITTTPLRQTSMGMSAGAFNTREFFHGVTTRVLANVRRVLVVMGYALPALFAMWGLQGGGTLAWVLAAVVQAPGMVADRWFFFAQARHPQNLYYQVVS
jgi:DMSO reductase anchor subunit